MGLELEVVGETNKYDVIIIGGGVAGMTAAIYCKRANLKTCFLDGDVPGGKITKISKIQNFPGIADVNGADLAYSLFDQATNKLGANYIYGIVTGLKKRNDKFYLYTKDQQVWEAKAIIIATGSKSKKLNVDGEEQYLQKGVSYCAVCDGSLTKQKTVVVIGGGNSAIDAASYLSNIAQKVYMVHRRNEFKTTEDTINNLKKIKNIELITPQTVFKIEGDLKTVKSIVLSDGTKINTDFVFVTIGYETSLEFLSNDIKTDERGFVVIDKNMKTTVDGVYAAGDCVFKPHFQIVNAMSDGAAAALNAIAYINNLTKK